MKLQQDPPGLVFFPSFTVALHSFKFSDSDLFSLQWWSARPLIPCLCKKKSLQLSLKHQRRILKSQHTLRKAAYVFPQLSKRVVLDLLWIVDSFGKLRKAINLFRKQSHIHVHTEHYIISQMAWSLKLRDLG